MWHKWFIGKKRHIKNIYECDIRSLKTLQLKEFYLLATKIS